jgi:hypothetical protein
MPHAQRVAQYIQQIAYKSLFQHEERDERPEDVPPRAPEPKYATWNATSFAVYVPFSSPTNG